MCVAQVVHTREGILTGDLAHAASGQDCAERRRLAVAMSLAEGRGLRFFVFGVIFSTGEVTTSSSSELSFDSSSSSSSSASSSCELFPRTNGSGCVSRRSCPPVAKRVSVSNTSSQVRVPETTAATLMRARPSSMRSLKSGMSSTCAAARRQSPSQARSSTAQRRSKCAQPRPVLLAICPLACLSRALAMLQCIMVALPATQPLHRAPL
ncbi:uncharacterized protein B0I36DRAFT_319806 [Microdochium trichocladiopsis]|uniref:Uncharacterized protein n=1 Tax=Microdochium trichocladiopsis TaxID=1682393 RepID=A0A9P8Y8T5_9PEZI|nr:uncharacterized protein B0I36DRAFT_319806 [Microdochium trichocladiopsis]KAH7032656.1 hypothetical protein B0I36DRAFT_319806 [Microdochium trichocladiopsis]